MRVFLFSVLSYFCLCLNLSAETRPSPETYVGKDGKLIALSRDQYYHRHYLESMDGNEANNQYLQVIDYIRAHKSVTIEQIDRLIEEKYNDNAEIYGMLAFFFANMEQAFSEDGSIDKILEEMPETERNEYNSAIQYLRPTDNEKDYNKAEYYFLRALDKSQHPYFTAMYEMAFSLFYGTPENPLYNTEKWLTHITRAAELGMGSARFQLGSAYLNGDKVLQDGQKAYEWIKKAADENDYYYALVLLSGILFEREGEGRYPNFPYDNAELIHYGQKVIDLYNLNGAYGLIAIAYELGGKNMRPDHKKAFENIEKCVEYGGSSPCYKILGEYYRDGIGTEVNLDKARASFQTSIDMGDKEAQKLLDALPEAPSQIIVQ